MRIGVKIFLTVFLLILIVSVIAYASDAGRESQFSIGSASFSMTQHKILPFGSNNVQVFFVLICERKINRKQIKLW